MYTCHRVPLLFALPILVPLQAAAASTPTLVVDAMIDGVVEVCFDAQGLVVGPLDQLPYKYRWTCNTTGRTRECYRVSQGGPVPFAYFVGDYYIAFTCTGTSSGSGQPPPSGRIFFDGFEP